MIAFHERAEGREYDKPIRDALDRFAARIAPPIAATWREEAVIRQLERIEARMMAAQPS